jgi:alpha-L-fucosidase 2
MPYRKKYTFFLLFLFPILSFFKASAQTLPSDVLTELNGYNVSWDSASTTDSKGSMPLGNGDITANVWVESNGDLMMYIGKSDSWSEGTRLFKIGRLRITMSPNPFATGQPFLQVLNLYKGEIDITAGNPGSQVNLKIWIDANNAVIRVEATGDHNFIMSCKTEMVRPTPHTIITNDPLISSYWGVGGDPSPPTESADLKTTKTGSIEWYHRNTSSPYQAILNNASLSTFSTTYPDPYLNLTFGALAKGTNFSVVNDSLLQSTSGNSFALSVYPYTAQTSTASLWDTQLASQVTQIDQTDTTTAYTNHCTWWDAFWNRSWIFITGDAAATTVTRGYLLQRFMDACQGRGKYPIKFNGGTLTMDSSATLNADYRAWGPAYWNQNTRLIYWPLLGSGDYDLIKPWFNQYMNMLSIQTAATNKYYNHGGAFFPETFNIFGLYTGDDWGWGNTTDSANNRYIRYHYQGALETLAQMLDYYDYTKDTSFVTNYIAPYATQVIRFFDQHWQRVNGKIYFAPSDAIETYWDCINPADYISGLRYTIPRLTVLSAPAITASLKSEWSNCYNSLPPLPMNQDSTAVLPAQVHGGTNNQENPECYSIFPYKIYGVGRPTNMNVGITTFSNRLFKNMIDWGQDPIQAPLLKFTDLAKQYVTADASASNPNVRFPAFWGPIYDYLPDLDNGGALMMGVQNMLIQNVGDSIYVLPSWPATWNVDYKLQALDNTSVRIISNGINISQLTVTPSSRRPDVVLPDGKQNQTMTIIPEQTMWIGDADAIGYATVNTGLPVTYTSSDTTIATIINGKIHAVGVGTCTISASQVGNTSYYAAIPATQILTVLEHNSSSTLIQAENYTGQSGIQTETTGDVGGGLDVDFIDNGDYTYYNNVNFGTGVTTMQLRVATYSSLLAAGTIQIRAGSPTGTLLGIDTVEGTGGWQNWITTSCTLAGATGTQNIYLVYSGGFNINWLSFEPVSTPYGGTPWPIPGTIQAENYDLGGEGIAYHDDDSTNDGGQYRLTEGVDVETCSEGGYDIGYINAGEWENYTVNVDTAGKYILQVRVASPNSGESLHIELDGVNISGSIVVPNTGGYQTWQTVSDTTSFFTTGQHVIRVGMETTGFNFDYIKYNLVPPPSITSADTASGNIGLPFTYTIIASSNPTSYNASALPLGLTIDTTTGIISGIPGQKGTFIDTVKATNSNGTGWKVVTFDFTASTTQSPYGGTPAVIPGIIQAENYDNGGEGIAYHDDDTTNDGGQYRLSEGVDVETTGDTGGGYDVGYTNAGEWMKYTVNVILPGVYTLEARVASPGTGNTFHVELDGVNISGTITVPNTTGWQTFQTAIVTTPSLTTGSHILRIFEETGGFNINYISFVPQLLTACPNGTLSFIAATPAAGNSYQWQLNNGTGYTNINNGAIYSGVATDTLTISNAQSSLYGYAYRCAITNNSIVTYNATNTLLFEDVWTGATSAAWETAGNWSCGVVPDSNTDVLINSGTPVINSTVNIRSLELNPAAQLTVSPGKQLNILH